MSEFLFTSESVSMGHPDKVCDQISDALLDEYLKQDNNSKVAIECFISDGLLVIAGEVHSNATVDATAVAEDVIKNRIGYTKESGFDFDNSKIIVNINEQSQEIRNGVERDNPEKMGAGDQGIMFGYATSETMEALPLPILLSNITMSLYDIIRRKGEAPYVSHLRPDGKCQYTVKYNQIPGGKKVPVSVDTVIFSFQHDEDITSEEKLKVFNDIMDLLFVYHGEFKKYFNENTKILVNPAGDFTIGGPKGDTGLTGRKIIVDTYGGMCPHGGGAFSGKDATKEDRSGAYAARYIAKNIVKAGLADEITIQLSYAIGVANPVSIYIDGVNLKKSKEEIIKMIYDLFPLKPYDIITKLELNKPSERWNYYCTSHYGHFRNRRFPWEECNKTEEIKKYFKLA